MYTPDKVAMVFLKFIVGMMLFSLITSLANVVPYFIQMNHAANDLLLRGAVNNYILESQVKETIKTTFVDNALFNTLTAKEGGGTGVQVWARTSTTAGNLYSDCTLGSGCNNSDSAKKVIINESGSFDPKTNTDDMVKFRDPSGPYKGAQRGDTISVRLEAKVNCAVVVIGQTFIFRVPIAVVKSGPAMHYFRI